MGNYLTTYNQYQPVLYSSQSPSAWLYITIALIVIVIIFVGIYLKNNKE